MAILEETAGASRRLTSAEVLAHVRELGLSTASEAVAMIREDRDASAAAALLFGEAAAVAGTLDRRLAAAGAPGQLT